MHARDVVLVTHGLPFKRQLLLWLAGGALTYSLALSYTEKGMGQSLTQSVRSLARQVKTVGSGLLIDFPRAAQDIMESNPQDRLSYMVTSLARTELEVKTAKS